MKVGTPKKGQVILQNYSSARSIRRAVSPGMLPDLSVSTGPDSLTPSLLPLRGDAVNIKVTVSLCTRDLGLLV